MNLDALQSGNRYPHVSWNVKMSDWCLSLQAFLYMLACCLFLVCSKCDIDGALFLFLILSNTILSTMQDIFFSLCLERC